MPAAQPPLKWTPPGTCAPAVNGAPFRWRPAIRPARRQAPLRGRAGRGEEFVQGGRGHKAGEDVQSPLLYAARAAGAGVASPSVPRRVPGRRAAPGTRRRPDGTAMPPRPVRPAGRRARLAARPEQRERIRQHRTIAATSARTLVRRRLRERTAIVNASAKLTSTLRIAMLSTPAPAPQLGRAEPCPARRARCRSSRPTASRAAPRTGT